MGPGSEGGEEFAVEETEPGVYNLTGAEPPLWQPAPQDILLMFDQLEKDQVLPLKWVCPGRRPPETEAPEQPLNDMSDRDDEDEDKEEEKRAPEPSAFDFDDTGSEASAKVKMTPRTPAQAKRPEKKLACMDNIISSLKRQQKAEREARKSQARLGMTGAFRSGGGGSGGGGTPSRVGAAGFSPSTSPRVLSASASPGPGSPRGSPRVSAPTTPPSSRLAADGGEGMTEKKAGGGRGQDSPSATVAESPGGPSGGGDSAVDRESSSKGPASEASATEVGSSSSGPAVAGPAPSSSTSSGSGEAGVAATIKVEQQDGGEGDKADPEEMEVEPSDSVAVVKQEG